MTGIGKAYGLFDCDAPKEEIGGLLPRIRKRVKTPPALMHYLVEGMENLDGDFPDSVSRYGKDNGFRYVLKAELPGASNRETAEEVAGILNQVYQSRLFMEGDPFRGGVVYEDNGNLAFMD